MEMRKETNKMNECYSCKHKEEVPGSCHLRCGNPDNEMTGNSYGKSQGWFFYPSNYDPVWKTKDCSNYEPKN